MQRADLLIDIMDIASPIEATRRIFLGRFVALALYGVRSMSQHVKQDILVPVGMFQNSRP